MRIVRHEYYSPEERDLEWAERKKQKLDTHVYTEAHRIGEFWLMIFGLWFQE